MSTSQRGKAKPSETLAALLHEVLDAHDHKGPEPFCEYLAACLTARGVRVGDEGLRAALRDANLIVKMMREHLAKDHPECLYDALGILNDANRAALAATPNPPEIDVERLARAITQHAADHKRHSRTHVRADCAVAIAAAYKAES